MLITRNIEWSGEDLGEVTLLSLVGETNKQWGLATSNVLISAHTDRKSAEIARAKLIKTEWIHKITLLSGLGPHVVRMQKIKE